MYTPFAYAFAYAIKQTPYAFVSKIILYMYLLYARAVEFKMATGCKFLSLKPRCHTSALEYLLTSHCFHADALEFAENMLSKRDAGPWCFQ